MKPTRRALVTGLSLFAFASSAHARQVIFLKAPGGPPVTPVILAKTLGRSTASGVSFVQLPAGASISSPGSLFSVDANGLVTTTAAFVTSGQMSGTTDVSLTGVSGFSTLRVTLNPGEADYDNGTALSSAVNAGSASADSVHYLTDTFVDGAGFTATKQFSGTISQPNYGKTAVDSIANPASILPDAVATWSGGSCTLKARTPGAPRFDNKVNVVGSGPFILDGAALRNIPTQDTYNAKFNEVKQSVLWRPTVSGGAVTGVASFDQTGVGYLASPNERRVYIAAKSQTVVVDISVASPAVVTYPAHGLVVNQPVSFVASDAAAPKLPTGMGTQTYYVKTVIDANHFTFGSSTGSTSQVGVTDAGTGVFRAGPGANFQGYFDANADGTIDQNSPLTIVTPGTGYDATTQFRQPTLVETTQLGTCQSYEPPALAAVQLGISASGSTLSKVVIKNCNFGNPGGDINRIGHCIDIRNSSQCYIEDCVFDTYYIGYQVWQSDDFEITRCLSRNNANDWGRQYPSSSPVGAQATTGPNCRHLGNVLLPTTADPSWSNSHVDAFQGFGIPSDLAQANSAIIRFNRVYWPGSIKNLQSQFTVMGGTPYPAHFDISDNLAIISTQNGFASGGQSTDTAQYDRNTLIRYIDDDITGINPFSPGYPFCINPWFPHKGPQSSTATYFYGDIVSDGAGNYYTSPWNNTQTDVNTGRSLSDTKYWRPYPKFDVSIRNNILGQIWPSIPTATSTSTATRWSEDPAGGVYTNGIYNIHASGNGYLSNYTPNTGAGNSIPEVLSGGPVFFSNYGGSDIGWRGYINKITALDYAGAKAQIDAAFSTKAGTAYSGKGYRQAA